jgi:hypothetical protein
MCSGTMVFLLSLSQISLASEAMVKTNSVGQQRDEAAGGAREAKASQPEL